MIAQKLNKTSYFIFGIYFWTSLILLMSALDKNLEKLFIDTYILIVAHMKKTNWWQLFAIKINLSIYFMFTY